MARICQRAARDAKKELGLNVGLVRPITLWPYPYEQLAKCAAQASVKHVLCVEMSTGQMVDDVRLAVSGMKPVSFYGRPGGMVPTVKDILAKLSSIKEGM